jgi:hypothetical protein
MRVVNAIRMRWGWPAVLALAAAALVGAWSVRAGAQAPAPQTEASAKTWFCPMHPDVTADVAGRCRKCGMAFIAGNPFEARDYELDLTTTPRAVKAGVPFRMTLGIGTPVTNDRVKEFEVVHDRRYHLFVVSHDLSSFQHLHPEAQPDGTWALDLTVPTPGYYRVLSDFLPSGGSPQFLGRTLVTAGFDGDLLSQAARLEPDTIWRKTSGSITADLSFEPPLLTAGQFGHLQYTLSDSKTGEPVTDLQPYLGAFGHTLILSEDLVDAVHSHPSEWLTDEVSQKLGGPRVTFEGYMPRPGRYRAWTQFLRRDELTTLSFTFQVVTLDEAVRGR